MRFRGEKSSAGTSLAVTLLVSVFLLMLGVAGSAESKLVKDKARVAGAGPDEVFSAIAAAWQSGDEAALAQLVHQDGLRVTTGDYDRFINYSPSQAYYYFKNQFQLHPTVSFQFERLEETPSGRDRMHGMVVWEYRRAHVTALMEKRLVLVLTRQDSAWRLSEINTITVK